MLRFKGVGAQWVYVGGWMGQGLKGLGLKGSGFKGFGVLRVLKAYGVLRV